MPYEIEVREDLCLLISRISNREVSEDDVNVFLSRVVAYGKQFAEAGSTHMYHALVVEPRDFNFASGLRSIRVIQQNRGLIDMRKRLNTMTILVGKTPKIFQIMITLLSRPSFGGRTMMVFPTIEAAIAFVEFDIKFRNDAQS